LSYQVREDTVPDKMQHFPQDSFTDDKHGWHYELVDALDDLYRSIEEEVSRWKAAGRHIPTQDQIDAVVDIFGRYKGTICESEVLREFLLPLGIGVQ